MTPRRLFFICILAAATLHGGLLLLARTGSRGFEPARLVQISLEVQPRDGGRQTPPAEEPGTREAAAPAAPEAPAAPSPSLPAPSEPAAAVQQPAEQSQPETPRYPTAEVPEEIKLPVIQEEESAPEMGQAAAPSTEPGPAFTPVTRGPEDAEGPGGPVTPRTRAAGPAGPTAGGGTHGGSPGLPGGSAGPDAGLTTARPVSRIAPVYPRAARRLRQEGTVRVEVVIDASGRVVSAKLASSSGHPLLDRAAMEAVKAALFSPALRDGKAVATRQVQPIRFSLSIDGGGEER
jgi:periplasmic protein TonB